MVWMRILGATLILLIAACNSYKTLDELSEIDKMDSPKNDEGEDPDDSSDSDPSDDVVADKDSTSDKVGCKDLNVDNEFPIYSAMPDQGVTRAYLGVLGRAPSSSEKAVEIKNLQKLGLPGWCKALETLLSSEEFKFRDNKELLKQFYEGFLGPNRPVDSTGQAAFEGLMKSGEFLKVALTLTRSAEFINKSLAFPMENMQEAIKRAYLAVLQREADQGGLDGHTKHIQNKQMSGWFEVLVAIVGSDEFEKNVKAKQSHEQILNIWYQQFLQRDPDSVSKNIFLKLMADKKYVEVASIIATSPEFFSGLGKVIPDIFSTPKIHEDDKRRFAMGGKTFHPVGYYPSIATFVGAEDAPLGFYKEFLEAIRISGLNYVRQVVNMGQPRGNSLNPYVRSGSGQAADGGSKFDLDRFDDGFFKHWKNIVEYALERKIVLQLSIFDTWHNKAWITDDGGSDKLNWGMKYDYYEGNNNINSVKTSSSKDWTDRANKAFEYQRRFIERIIQELGAYPNIIWEVTNENVGSTSWEMELANYVSEVEGRLGLTKHLVMPRDLPEHRNVAGHDVFESPEEIHDALRIQVSATQSPLVSDNDCCLDPRSPEYRRQKGWSVLTAGGHTNFFHLLSFANFQTGTAREGMKYLGLINQFIKHFKIDLSGTVSRDDLANSGAWVLVHPGRDLIVYQKTGGALSLKGVGDQAQAHWFNPRNGEITPAVYNRNQTLAEFQAPDKNDWVLYVLNKSEVDMGPAPNKEVVDLSQVNFLHFDVSKWPVTSIMTSLKITGKHISFNHTKSGLWPSTDPFNDPNTPIESNIWVIAQVNGQWYAATWDWVRPGQKEKEVDAANLGLSTKSRPLTQWKPRSGEILGFMISTPMRFTSPLGPIRERSNVFWTRWP